jgi:uncharacterized protein with PIN domain
MNIKRKKITLRFYEELNDFLPKEKRKKRFTHTFIDRTSVKDLIESLGVPHTEVDLILVNGKSVSFKYLIKDGDDISVYPVFESMDIIDVQHLRSTPLRRPKFICDVHLGKLARKMRMMGFDVYYENNLSDDQIVKISLSEKRTILTRDLGILKRTEVTHGYFVREQDPEKQTTEILIKFQLMGLIKPFTLCLECGTKLSRIARKEVINILPENVKKSKGRFMYCTNCKKVYWEGSHFNNMKNFINAFLKLNSKN